MARNIAVDFKLGVTGSVDKAVKGIKAVGKQSQRTQKLLDGFKSAARSLVAPLAALATVEGLRSLTVDTIELGNEIARTAERTNASTAQIAELGRIAKSVGLDLDDVRDLLSETAVKARDAALGSTGLQETFDRLGVSVTDVNGNLRSEVDLLRDVGNALNNMENRTEAAAIADELWSDAGYKLLPVLGDITKGLDAQDSAMSRLADKLKEAKPLFDEMGRAGAELRAEFVTALLPAIEWGAKALVDFNRYLKENEEVVVVLKVALTALAVPVWAIVEAVKQAANGVQTLVDVMKALMNLDLVGALKAIGNGIRRVGEAAANAARSFRDMFQWATRGNRAAAGGRAPAPAPAQAEEAMAAGGVVRRPTVALIGEAGPEAVVPLSGGRSIPVVIQAPDGRSQATGGATVTIHQTVNLTSAGSAEADNSALLRRMAMISEQAVERGLHRAGF